MGCVHTQLNSRTSRPEHVHQGVKAELVDFPAQRIVHPGSPGRHGLRTEYSEASVNIAADAIDALAAPNLESSGGRSKAADGLCHLADEGWGLPHVPGSCESDDISLAWAGEANVEGQRVFTASGQIRHEIEGRRQPVALR